MPTNAAPLSIIAGLGNPGKEYTQTRHNIGFLAVDELAKRVGESNWRSRFGAEHVVIQARTLILIKPTSFMNDSGPPIYAIAQYYKVPIERCLVISDDLDQPFGRLRMRKAGGHGGHNGLRSIIASMSERFPRLRVGIGRGHDVHDDAVVARVLGKFSPEECANIPTLLAAVADGAQTWLTGDDDAAMRFVNSWSGLPVAT